MPGKKVTLHQKIDGTDRTITVSERSVPVHEAAGWKVASRTRQAPPEAAPPEVTEPEVTDKS